MQGTEVKKRPCLPQTIPKNAKYANCDDLETTFSICMIFPLKEGFSLKTPADPYFPHKNPWFKVQGMRFLVPCKSPAVPRKIDLFAIDIKGFGDFENANDFRSITIHPMVTASYTPKIFVVVHEKSSNLNRSPALSPFSRVISPRS